MPASTRPISDFIDRHFLHFNAAALKLAAVRFRDSEIANVLAYLREGTGQQRAVAGETVDQRVDLLRVLQTSFTNGHRRSPVLLRV